LNVTRIAGAAGIINLPLVISALLLAVALCGPGCGTGSQTSNAWASDGSFSWTSNALSDLGVSKVAPTFNFSLIISGLLVVVFGVGMAKTQTMVRFFRLSGPLFLLCGLSLSLVGVFTEASGSLHSAVALSYFFLGPIGMTLVGVGYRRAKETGRGKLGIATGTLGLSDDIHRPRRGWLETLWRVCD
jgi:hypothetical membrane protein